MMDTEQLRPADAGRLDPAVGRPVPKRQERPLLFSAPMVRAILDGTKTQTRRMVSWRGVDAGLNLGFSGLSPHGYSQGWVLESPSRSSREWRCKPTPCPFGQRGDRLWVRETWAAPHNCDHLKPSEIDHDWRIHYAATEDLGGLLRRPSMFMPRWASRITLEITDVRVERLHDISRGEAMAEGCPFPNMADGDDPRAWFANLWRQINGADSWADNPWVWVLAFRKTPNEKGNRPA